jgi:hypothetical protein
MTTGNDPVRIPSPQQADFDNPDQSNIVQGSGRIVQGTSWKPKRAPTVDELRGAKIVDWYQAMFEKTTTFASILASAMFSAMILDLDPGKIPNGTEKEVRTWAASGALHFVILVLLCTGCSLFLKYHSEAIAKRYVVKDLLVGFGFALGSLLFQGLLLSGTMFFCLVVKAYAPAIGWTAFGITAFCTLISFGIWAWELKNEIMRQLGRTEFLKIRERLPERFRGDWPELQDRIFGESE